MGWDAWPQTLAAKRLYSSFPVFGHCRDTSELEVLNPRRDTAEIVPVAMHV